MCENQSNNECELYEIDEDKSEVIHTPIPVITLDDQEKSNANSNEVFRIPYGSLRSTNLGCDEMMHNQNTNSNSADESITQCPICNIHEKSAVDLEQHINLVHFDSAGATASPVAESKIFSCFLCTKSFDTSSALESHFHSVHDDVLSPSKPSLPISTKDDMNIGICPVCLRSEFSSSFEFELHVDTHFSKKSSVDKLGLGCQQTELEDINEKFKKEQQELSQLRSLYGMDNGGSFSQQSITNMEKSVYSGEMSVADFYERKIDLNVMEQKGLDDGKSCTTGLIQSIRSVCESSNKVKSVWLCSDVIHYASTYGDRGWGCGYRNIQMLLSCLRNRNDFYNCLFSGLSQMPSISQIQKQIESAWKLGFDSQGCEQLEGKLYGTRKWIGATEVATLFASSRIRFRLIDFHRPTGLNGTHPELFQWCLDYFSKPSDFKPPIYLQHQGHSRTIVGVEELRDSEFPRLLIFDPGHSPSQMAQLSLKQSAFKAMHLIRKNISGMKSKQYQLVVVDGDLLETEQEYNECKILRSIRIPKT